jgi:hypothetical protein
VVCEVCLALLAADDAVAVQVDVVREAHGSSGLGGRLARISAR